MSTTATDQLTIEVREGHAVQVGGVHYFAGEIVAAPLADAVRWQAQGRVYVIGVTR
jgi:hypothetical protein